MKKKLIAALSLGAVALALTGCNKKVFDFNYELNYIVLEENGEHVLHEIKNWQDSETESVVVTTECCNNYIWSSANKATVYKDKPSSVAYDHECGQ